MDFEKEMQKALKVISKNIQALDDNRVELSAKLNDSVRRGKRRQRKVSSMSLDSLPSRTSSNCSDVSSLGMHSS